MLVLVGASVFVPTGIMVACGWVVEFPTVGWHLVFATAVAFNDWDCGATCNPSANFTVHVLSKSKFFTTLFWQRSITISEAFAGAVESDLKSLLPNLMSALAGSEAFAASENNRTCVFSEKFAP